MSASDPVPAELAALLEVEASLAPTEAELPALAIVILNWNGRGHLAPCFQSLLATDYPADRRRIVLVDNGSDDGSVEEVRRDWPMVELAVNPRNVGFSSGCNQGARLAEGVELLVFLNNDIRVEPDFLRALVAPIVAGRAVATTGKMLAWDGKTIDSAGGGMNFHGIGIQRGYRAALHPRYDVPRRSLFACGGAMAMRRDVFEELGGFDEQFFAYYEDVDLGWRTWVAGHEVHYAPAAVCYHHHSSTSRRLPVERLRLLQIRNPLLACFKNYDDDNLRRVLPAMLSLATRRAYLATGLGEAADFRIEGMTTLPRDSALRRAFQKHKKRTTPVDPVAIADLVGINDLLGQWDHWAERRAQVQALRARPDADILPLFLHPLWCIEHDYGYVELHRGLCESLGLNDLFRGLTSLEEKPH